MSPQFEHFGLSLWNWGSRNLRVKDMVVGHRDWLEGHSLTLSGLSSAPQMCEQIISQSLATMGWPVPVTTLLTVIDCVSNYDPQKACPSWGGLYHYKAYSGSCKDKMMCTGPIGKMPWEHFGTWQGSTHFRFQCLKLQTHLETCLWKREAIQAALFKTGHIKKCFPGSSSRESEGISVA